MKKDIARSLNHPIHLLTKKISFLLSGFEFFINEQHSCTIREAFDELMFPINHVSRTSSDTIFCDRENVLRSQMTSFELAYLKRRHERFLVLGKVVRKDEIDSLHFPVFHQLEGVYANQKWNHISKCVLDLKSTLESLTKGLFGEFIQYRWLETVYPYTDPSYELEILKTGEWIEVFGCGVLRPAVLKNTPYHSTHTWAFGIGMERMAMIYFGIKDIRELWNKKF